MPRNREVHPIKLHPARRLSQRITDTPVPRLPAPKGALPKVPPCTAWRLRCSPIQRVSLFDLKFI